MSDAIKTQIENYLRASPFVAFMGLELVSMQPAEGKLTLQMNLKPEFERSAESNGRWHGGVISALADTAGDFALIMMHDAPPPTINLRMDYIRPIVGQCVMATATVRKTGRTIAFVDINILTEDGMLVAIARANYATVGLQPVNRKEAVS